MPSRSRRHLLRPYNIDDNIADDGIAHKTAGRTINVGINPNVGWAKQVRRVMAAGAIEAGTPSDNIGAI